MITGIQYGNPKGSEAYEVQSPFWISKNGITPAIILQKGDVVYGKAIKMADNRSTGLSVAKSGSTPAFVIPINYFKNFMVKKLNPPKPIAKKAQLFHDTITGKKWVVYPSGQSIGITDISVIEKANTTRFKGSIGITEISVIEKAPPKTNYVNDSGMQVSVGTEWLKTTGKTVANIALLALAALLVLTGALYFYSEGKKFYQSQ